VLGGRSPPDTTYDTPAYCRRTEHTKRAGRARRRSSAPRHADLPQAGLEEVRPRPACNTLPRLPRRQPPRPRIGRPPRRVPRGPPGIEPGPPTVVRPRRPVAGQSSPGTLPPSPGRPQGERGRPCGAHPAATDREPTRCRLGEPGGLEPPSSTRPRRGWCSSFELQVPAVGQRTGRPVQAAVFRDFLARMNPSPAAPHDPGLPGRGQHSAAEPDAPWSWGGSHAQVPPFRTTQCRLPPLAVTLVTTFIEASGPHPESEMVAAIAAVRATENAACASRSPPPARSLSGPGGPGGHTDRLGRRGRRARQG